MSNSWPRRNISFRGVKKSAVAVLSLAAVLLCVALVSWMRPRDYRAPRTSFGDPDLQGLWTNLALTPLERGTPGPLVLSEERALRMQAKFRERFEKQDFFQKNIPESIRPEHTVKKGLPVPKAMLGYDSSWWDIEAPFGKVRGGFRSSWIVDPPDGKVPYSEAALARMKELFLKQRFFDGPESRRLGERCLLGFGSTSGPPMLNVEYNNHYRIFQGPGYVAILVEMVHDVRMIPIGKERLPDAMRPWMGDSSGRWDGDTLVVETRNRHPEQDLVTENNHVLYLPSSATVTERFTRVAEDEIFYEFRVEDPVAYRQPWRAEMTFRATKGPMFEFACHEGNRSMEYSLAGARHTEKMKSKKETK